jgi:hypothetical protein
MFPKGVDYIISFVIKEWGASHPEYSGQYFLSE